MAKMTFEAFQESASSFNQGGSDVKFFGLADDGDTAIVRIMHDSTADFDLGTVHQIKLGDSYRKVACIRDPREPVANCPLCNSGTKLQQRIFLHLISYEKQPDGSVVATPCVWERAAKEYATKLQSLIQEYGPLSDCIFKIKRNGKKKDMQTTYEIMYCNPALYPDDVYAKNTEVFKNYSAFGRIVLNKNFEEINTFMQTGSFPQASENTNGLDIEAIVDDTPTSPVTPQVNYQPQAQPPVAPQYNAPTSQPMYAPQTPTATPNRPTRHY